MKFMGRDKELQHLEQFLQWSQDKVAVISGMRFIGKSALLQELLRRSQVCSLYFDCRETSLTDNMEKLLGAISQQLQLPVLALNSFEDVLEYLVASAHEEPLVMAFDDFQNFRKFLPEAAERIGAVLQRHAADTRLKLILAGRGEFAAELSRDDPSIERLIGLDLKLAPMDYLEVSAFYPGYSAADKVRLFSVFGGNPFYASRINPKRSVRENIIELAGSPKSLAAIALSQSLEQELTKMESANLILSALAQSELKFSDLLEKTGITKGATITYPLNKLLSMQLLRKETPINVASDRRALYAIADPLTLFFYRFIEPNLDAISAQGAEAAFDVLIARPFAGRHVLLTLASITRQFLLRLKRAGKLPVPFSRIGRYVYEMSEEKRIGSFEVVTLDERGYMPYAVNFGTRALRQSDLEAVQRQLMRSPLACDRFGFISRAGYEDVEASDNVSLYTLDDLYDLKSFS